MTPRPMLLRDAATSLRLRAALAAVLTFVSGCATPIINVTVTADVPSVRVLEGTRTLGAGRPPLTLRLPADVDHDLIVTAEGREAKPVRLVSVTDGGRVALTVVQCVLFPIVIFMLPLVISRGVCKTLDPTEVSVTLGPGSGVPAPVVTRPTPVPAPRPTPPPAPRPTPSPAPRPPQPQPSPAPPPPAPATSSPRPAFCSRCGAPLAEGAAFCGGCGERLR